MLKIRKVRSDEGPAIRKIWASALREKKGVFEGNPTYLESHSEETVRRWAENWQSSTEETVHVLTDLNEEIQGFCLSHRQTEHVKIPIIYLHPEIRDKGYGRKLLEHMETYHRTHSGSPLAIELWVHEDNPARMFYKQLGYEPTGKSKPSNRYPGKTFTEMRKTLRPAL